MYCLTILLVKLKPQTGKTSADERVDAIICFSQVCTHSMYLTMHNDSCTHSMAQKQCKKKRTTLILCVGSLCNITSAILVCIISKEIGKTVFSALFCWWHTTLMSLRTTPLCSRYWSFSRTSFLWTDCHHQRCL